MLPAGRGAPLRTRTISRAPPWSMSTSCPPVPAWTLGQTHGHKQLSLRELAPERAGGKRWSSE